MGYRAKEEAMFMLNAEPEGKQAATDYQADLAARLQIRRQIREAIQSLQARYGIRVDMHRHTQSDAQDITHLEKLNLIQAVAALQTIHLEVAKYPPEYLQVCDLRRLRLVQTLQTHEPALPQAVDYVGRTYYEERTIYLATCGEGLYGLAGTLHHELFHLSDRAHLQSLLQTEKPQASHGSLALIYQAMYDQEWTQLNSQQEQAYVGLAALPSLLPTQEEDLPGFALAYGTINAWEDRATVAGFLLTAPQAALAKAQSDPVFCSKLTRIMLFYQQRSSGRMDPHYFRDLVVGNVSEGYWWNSPTGKLIPYE